MATTELKLSTGATVKIADDREELDEVRLRVSDGVTGVGHSVVINLSQGDLVALRTALTSLPPP